MKNQYCQKGYYHPNFKEFHLKFYLALKFAKLEPWSWVQAPAPTRRVHRAQIFLLPPFLPPEEILFCTLPHHPHGQVRVKHSMEHKFVIWSSAVNVYISLHVHLIIKNRELT